jgi:hypothetical protein
LNLFYQGRERLEVYYESRKRELKRRLINEGRCDERLKSKVEKNPREEIVVVYLQQIKKKAKAEGKTCHAKTMLSLENPIKFL